MEQNIFTFKEQTVKSHTMLDAYKQAAMVIRHNWQLDHPRRNPPSNQQVFSRGTYCEDWACIKLTVKELSNHVRKIVSDYNRSGFFG